LHRRHDGVAAVDLLAGQDRAEQSGAHRLEEGAGLGEGHLTTATTTAAALRTTVTNPKPMILLRSASTFFSTASILKVSAFSTVSTRSFSVSNCWIVASRFITSSSAPRHSLVVSMRFSKVASALSV